MPHISGLVRNALLGLQISVDLVFLPVPANTLAHASAAAMPESTSNNSAGTPCPPVSPKNLDEKIRIQNASNHKGCWVRSSDGSLLFLSDEAPDKSYKPILGGSPASEPPPPPIRPSAGAPGISDPSGTWTMRQGTWSGAELPLIRAFSKAGEIQKVNGYDTVDVEEFRISFSRKSLGRYCGTTAGETFCLVNTGVSTYAIEDDTKNPNKCVYIVEGSSLRGQCIQSATVQLLVAGTRVVP